MRSPNEIVKSENKLNTIYANDSDSKKELGEQKSILLFGRRGREQGEPGRRFSREIVALEEGEALLILIKWEVFNPLACNSSADV